MGKTANLNWLVQDFWTRNRQYLCCGIFWLLETSLASMGFMIIFQQPRSPWNKGISFSQLLFGVRLCEVAIIWPDVFNPHAQSWHFRNTAAASAWLNRYSIHGRTAVATSDTSRKASSCGRVFDVDRLDVVEGGVWYPKQAVLKWMFGETSIFLCEELESSNWNNHH